MILILNLFMKCSVITSLLHDIWVLIKALFRVVKISLQTNKKQTFIIFRAAYSGILLLVFLFFHSHVQLQYADLIFFFHLYSLIVTKSNAYNAYQNNINLVLYTDNQK